MFFFLGFWGEIVGWASVFSKMSNSGDMDKRSAGSLSMAELGASLPPTSGGEDLSRSCSVSLKFFSKKFSTSRLGSCDLGVE